MYNFVNFKRKKVFFRGKGIDVSKESFKSLQRLMRNKLGCI